MISTIHPVYSYPFHIQISRQKSLAWNSPLPACLVFIFWMLQLSVLYIHILSYAFDILFTVLVFKCFIQNATSCHTERSYHRFACYFKSKYKACCIRAKLTFQPNYRASKLKTQYNSCGIHNILDHGQFQSWHPVTVSNQACYGTLSTIFRSALL